MHAKRANGTTGLPVGFHVYKNGREVAKIVVPKMRVLRGKINKKLKRIIQELLQEGKI